MSFFFGHFILCVELYVLTLAYVFAKWDQPKRKGDHFGGCCAAPSGAVIAFLPR
jgi:hypothetical protein